MEPRPTVQLLHERPDGSTHVDWMLARDAAGEGPLVTFRLPGRVDELAPPAALPAERIGDHRPRYLDYQGPLGPEPGSAPGAPDRGTVRRLARGRIVEWTERAGAWDLLVEWAGPRGRQRLRLEGGAERWSVRAVS